MVVGQLRRFLDRHGIGPCRLVVACSGGVDSTALLLAAAELRRDGYEIVCAHINHHLRGEESDADERFVRDLATQLAIAIDARDGSVTADSIRHRGIEAAAREVRHALLQEIRAGHGYIATAHQKNDQAETIVMRLISGTGLAGLRGIHEVRDDGVIRPLLEVTREEIEAFLAERSVTARRDRMNEDPRFLRNRVRAALRDFGPAAIHNIASVAAQAQAIWPNVEETIDRAEREHAEVTDSETRFKSWPADPWMRQALLHRHIRRLDEHWREVSSRDLERLASTVDTTKRVSVTKSLELIRRGGALVLRRVPQPAEDFEFSINAGEKLFIPQIDASVEIRPARPATRFTVRNRRSGDRFRHKKLKDFLIDRKIPAEVRDRIPVIECEGEIVWVGLDGSNQFQVTGKAGELFEVVLTYHRPA